MLERAGAILLCLTWCHVLDVCNGRPLVPSLGLPVMHLLSEVVEEFYLSSETFLLAINYMDRWAGARPGSHGGAHARP